MRYCVVIGEVVKLFTTNHSFSQPREKSPLKTLWKKEKMLEKKAL